MSVDQPIFIDTNVIVYAYSTDNEAKRLVARKLIESGRAVISAQVLNEFCNTTRRKYPLMFERASKTLNELAEWVDIRDLTLSNSLQAGQLTQRYGYSYYDSLIVAAALDAGCPVLISEDMQHGMLIDNRLRIIDPFLTV